MYQDNNHQFYGPYSNKPEAASREESKRRSYLNVQTFRVVKSYPMLGYIILLISAGLLFLALAPYETCKNIVAMLAPYEVSIYAFAALSGIPGIYLLLTFYISKVSIYPERIIHYGFTGRKKELLWSDITSSLIHYTFGRGGIHKTIYLYSDSKKMILDDRFKDHELIISIIKEKCRKAFLFEKIENGATQTLRMNTGIAITVFFTLVGIILGIFLITSYPTLSAQLSTRMLAFCEVAPVVFTISGVNNLLLWHFSRVIINAESITHINLFGVKKQIMWPEIESVNFFNSSRLARNMPSGVKLSGSGKTITLSGYYSGFEGVDEIIRKYSLR